VRRPSVADQTAHEERARGAALSPAERVALALELGERDLAAYAHAHGLSPVAARRALERRRQAGRRRSSRLEALLG
jgi:hypothetical protein